MDKSLIYTTDPNMASYKGEDKMPVQVGATARLLVDNYPHAQLTNSRVLLITGRVFSDKTFTG